MCYVFICYYKIDEKLNYLPKNVQKIKPFGKHERFDATNFLAWFKCCKKLV